MMYPLKGVETVKLLTEVYQERERQDAKWGEQNHPDGTSVTMKQEADRARDQCNLAAQLGKLTWLDILLEEVLEALSEEDPQNLRTELIQISAVALGWVAAIDRRNR